MSEFKDFDLTFEMHPSTGDVRMRTGVRAILQAVRELVLTEAGEWQYGEARDIGAGIYNQLGENHNPLDHIQMQDKIRYQIETFEPRAELIDLNIRSMSDEPNGLIVKIKFMVINEPEVQTLDIPLIRLR